MTDRSSQPAPGEWADAQVVHVIRVEYGRGRGIPDDPFRRVVAYFTFEGQRIAEHDPHLDESVPST